METQCSRCGFSSAEYRGSITALVLLATLFLIPDRMILAFSASLAYWRLMLNHLSTCTLSVLPQQAAFQPLWPKPVALWGAVVTQVQNWHFSCVAFAGMR